MYLCLSQLQKEKKQAIWKIITKFCFPAFSLSTSVEYKGKTKHESINLGGEIPHLWGYQSKPTDQKRQTYKKTLSQRKSTLLAF